MMQTLGPIAVALSPLPTQRRGDSHSRQDGAHHPERSGDCFWGTSPAHVSLPGGPEGKAPGDPGLIPGSGRSPGEGNGNPPQYSCLENPMDRGTWEATVQGAAESQTRLSDFAFLPFLSFPLPARVDLPGWEWMEYTPQPPPSNFLWSPAGTSQWLHPTRNHRTRLPVLVGPPRPREGGAEGIRRTVDLEAQEQMPTKGSKAEGATRVADARALPPPGCVTLSEAPNLLSLYFPLLEMWSCQGFYDSSVELHKQTPGTRAVSWPISPLHLL